MHAWIFPAVITFLFWGVGIVTHKISLRYLNPLSIVVYEGGGYFLISLLALFLVGFRPDFHVKGIAFAVITGILYSGGTIAFLYALNLGRISIVSVSTALYPIIPILFGYLILQETIALKEIIGMVFALIAICLFAL